MYDQDEQYREDYAEGVALERDRFAAVLGGPHYMGRQAAAHRMLYETDMSAEAINSVLAVTPLVASSSNPIDVRGIYSQRHTQSISGGVSTIVTAPKAAEVPNAADVYAERRKATRAN